MNYAISIQDYLVSLGFSVNESQGTFTKWVNGWTHVEIPFADLAGRTVEEFQRRAKADGWIAKTAADALPGSFGFV